MIQVFNGSLSLRISTEHAVSETSEVVRKTIIVATLSAHDAGGKMPI